MILKVDNSVIAVDRLLDAFARTTDQIFSLDSLRTRLLSGKRLTLKYGVDVTAPTLHIGHAVNLWMYRELQELGHRVVFLIGDFTTAIGDPTGKSKTRPVIPQEEIERNAKEFIEQALGVLHADSAVFEVRRNSEWCDKLSVRDFLSLLSSLTHDRLMSRDMFRRRQDAGEDIYMHEALYPVIQGFDSVALESDITIVGSDQLFNEMIGRFFQAKSGQAEQVVITTKITPGLDGREKQSKSLNNYVGLAHSPREKFGRLMSIPDELIEPYFRVYTSLPLEDSRFSAEAIKVDPMGAKLELATAVVARYHGESVAAAEVEWFSQTVRAGKSPEEIPEVHLDGEPPWTAFEVARQCLSQNQSNSHIRRLFGQRAVRFDDHVVSEPGELVDLPAIVKIGKRNWFRVVGQ